MFFGNQNNTSSCRLFMTSVISKLLFQCLNGKNNSKTRKQFFFNIAKKYEVFRKFYYVLEISYRMVSFKNQWQVTLVNTFYNKHLITSVTCQWFLKDSMQYFIHYKLKRSNWAKLMEFHVYGPDNLFRLISQMEVLK